MTDNEIMELVNNSLVEEFELDPTEMKPEASFREDLGLDSLDAVDMVIVLEQAFQFKIRENEALKSIQTLGDLYAFIINKRKTLEENAA